jgi:Fe/S biogenesis protein NfuA
MIAISETARDKVLEILKDGDRHGVALRVAITGRGRGPGGFGYELELIEENEKAPDDLVVDADGIKLIVDAMSAPKLEGATVDYVEDSSDSGFKIENPNSFFEDPTAISVQHVLDEQINPAVADHGGFVVLLDVKGDTAYIELGGGCQGCGMANVTLKQGVEVMIQRAVPEIKHVIDSTDHASGSNPYYQPAKGGGASPLA